MADGPVAFRSASQGQALDLLVPADAEIVVEGYIYITAQEAAAPVGNLFRTHPTPTPGGRGL